MICVWRLPRYLAWGTICLLLTAIVGSPRSSLGEDDDDVLRKAREACQERLKKAGTIRIAWKREDLLRKSSMTRSLESDGTASPGVDYPSTDVKEQGRCRLILRGASWRYDVSRKTWTFTTNDVTRDLDTSSVFHENRYRTLRRDTHSGVTGNIGVKNEIQPSIDVQSILASFMLPPFYTDDSSVAVLRSQRTETGGKAVVLGNTDYNRPGVIGATRVEVTLDAERDLIPIRSASMYPDGNLLCESLITYREHPLVGYVPDVITINLMDVLDQKVRISRTLSVQEIAFGEAISDSTFDLPFPPGAFVSDNVAQEAEEQKRRLLFGPQSCPAPKPTDDRQEVTSGKGAVLSRDEAAIVAAKLANKECSRLFGRTPFSPSDYPAVLIGSRWHWGRHDPAGIGGYSAEVRFDEDATKPEIEVLFHTDRLIPAEPRRRVKERP
jgi:hypothetical protein